MKSAKTLRHSLPSNDWPPNTRLIETSSLFDQYISKQRPPLHRSIWRANQGGFCSQVLLKLSMKLDRWHFGHSNVQIWKHALHELWSIYTRNPKGIFNRPSICQLAIPRIWPNLQYFTFGMLTQHTAVTRTVNLDDYTQSTHNSSMNYYLS